MEQTFLTGINIEKVRHLANISIPLDKEKRKHLILTGKNGSGKTSVLESMVKYVQSFLGENGTPLEHAKNMFGRYLNKINGLDLLEDSEEHRKQIYETKKFESMGK